jgi:SAM-dependent methyltransferase
MKERLLRATFTEGLPVADRATLVRLATEAGLPAAPAQAVLDGGAYADAVRADEQQAARYGITGVPFFVAEGADAIWLARSGWTVTAIDISDVAVTRAREAAERAGAAVEWVRGDALQTPFPAGSFGLVSMQYPALPKAAGEAATRALLDTVRPGGLLLAVYHDLDDEHREHMKSQGVDPADYVDADDLGRLLGDYFTIELHAVEPRIDPPPDNPHIADIVLRARRR